MDFSGKVAVVTGGASGIGAATVQAFVEAGAAVAIIDINQANGQAAANSYRSRGLPVNFFAVDVSDADACQAVMQQVVAAHGRIDCLVNCAVSFLNKGLDVSQTLIG